MASAFMVCSHPLAGLRVGTASRLEGASITFGLAGAVAIEAVGRHRVRTIIVAALPPLQGLSAGTGINISLGVVGEVGAREGAVRPVRLVEHRKCGAKSGPARSGASPGLPPPDTPRGSPPSRRPHHPNVAAE